MEMIKSVLIKNMKALRKVKGWNQEDLAEKTGYSTGFIKDIERGASWVSPEAIDKICEAFEVSCDKLFSIEGEGKMFDMPMSRAIKKLMAIPDAIYEKSQGIAPDNKVWETIEDALDIAHEAQKIKDIKKQNGSSHS